MAAQLRALLDEYSPSGTGWFSGEGPAAPLGSMPDLAGQTIGAYTLFRRSVRAAWDCMAGASAATAVSNAKPRSSSSRGVGRRGADVSSAKGRFLAACSSAHCASCSTPGCLAAGQPYLVLEYVDGQPIHRYCDQHNLDVKARVRLFLDVLAGCGARPRQPDRASRPQTVQRVRQPRAGR